MSKLSPAVRPLLTIVLCAVSLFGCTKPKQTTAIGSATGGAIGAGLGAIFGNQTGNAGSGLAIGAVAGAATGALIGNALQAQQEAVQAQDEALERQDRVIKAQRQEIEDLRSIERDSPATMAPSSYRPTQRSQQLSPAAMQKLAQLERRGPNPSGAPHASVAYNPPPLRSNTQPLARFDAETISASPAPKKPKIEVKTQPAPAPKKEQQPEAKVVVEDTTITETEIIDETSKKNGVVESDIAIEEVSTETAVLPPQQDQPSGSCSEAASEEQSAQAATENSQKLYHLRRALRLCPKSAKFHAELGKVYLAMDRKSDAQFEFSEALKSDARYQPAIDGLAQASSSSGEKF